MAIIVISKWWRPRLIGSRLDRSTTRPSALRQDRAKPAGHHLCPGTDHLVKHFVSHLALLVALGGAALAAVALSRNDGDQEAQLSNTKMRLARDEAQLARGSLELKTARLRLARTKARLSTTKRQLSALRAKVAAPGTTPAPAASSTQSNAAPTTPSGGTPSVDSAEGQSILKDRSRVPIASAPSRLSRAGAVLTKPRLPKR